MRRFDLTAVLGAFLLSLPAAVLADATEKAAAAESARRSPWTNSRIKGSPDPPTPYRCQRLFPKLNFEQPTVITTAPGSDRLFVAEQGGKIYSFVPDADCEVADLFVDIPADALGELGPDSPIKGFSAIYGLTFHPDFARNRECFICYVVQGKEPGQYVEGTRVSRFRVSDTEPPRVDPQSEQILITWMEGGHNGGCLKFSPRDGFLYISTGDAGNAFPPDGHDAGQDVSNLLSAILRIDVDRADAGRAYAVPADNPFVELPGARSEIWAYGFRNPWKMSFDRETGDLWVGDVGWELWELVYRVVRGGNYGWSIMEGNQPVHMEREAGPTPILPPTLDIPHIDGASITGGFVYRGKQLQELVGQYVFGDWETRRIWGARFDGQQLVGRRDLTEPTVRIVGFAEDHQGELLLLDYDDGAIYQLVENPVRGEQRPFPRRLSESGLFLSTADHRPAPGVLGFSIQAPQWADHAEAERMIGLPGASTITVHDQATKIPGSMFSRRMDFPEDAVLAKTLHLETEAGNAASRRRIETQILHFDGLNWRGYSYEWNEDQTDAELVPAAGRDRVIEVRDPRAPDGVRRQTWHFPGRAECGRCHNPWAEHTLAFNLPQLDRQHDYGSGPADQLAALRRFGILSFAAAADQQTDTGQGGGPLPYRLADPYDGRADLETRARSYLHVNCAHCHRFNGGGVSYIELRAELALEATKVLGTRPTQGTFGIHDARIITPGDPYRSVLFYRLAKLGAGRMPHVGSEEVDRRGLELIHGWIQGLPDGADDALAAEPGESLDELLRSCCEGGALDELLSTTSRALRLAWALTARELPEDMGRQAAQRASEHADPQIRDLFEPFLPPDQRRRKLGSVVRAEEILAHPGDVQRGRQLFHSTQGVQCKNCHQIRGDGFALGPDLSLIGQKAGRVQLLQNILEPSRNIDPKYATYLVETDDGRVYTGLLVERTDDALLLLDAQRQQIRIPLERVEHFAPQRQSLMPELLLRDLSAEQVADLLEYLCSLTSPESS